MHGSELSKSSNFVHAKAAFRANSCNLAPSGGDFCFAEFSLVPFACGSPAMHLVPCKRRNKTEPARSALFRARVLHQQAAAIHGDDLPGNEIRRRQIDHRIGNVVAGSRAV